jgi:hypothetical protein
MKCTVHTAKNTYADYNWSSSSLVCLIFSGFRKEYFIYVNYFNMYFPYNYHKTVSFYMVLQSFGPWWPFCVLILYAVGRTPWTGDQTVARPLSTHIETQIKNKLTQTSMPRVGFEPTIPVFGRAKTLHILDRAATVIIRPYSVTSLIGRTKQGRSYVSRRW